MAEIIASHINANPGRAQPNSIAHFIAQHF
jgi:hypothetical protein